MKQYNSVIEALESLKQRGFIYDFNLDEKKVCAPDRKSSYTSEEFKIVEVYRFEGQTNPSESSVVYAIQSDKYNLKGFLVNAYGMYADTHSTELVSKMHVEHHEVI